jgi:hypothetical protein
MPGPLRQVRQHRARAAAHRPAAGQQHRPPRAAQLSQRVFAVKI